MTHLLLPLLLLGCTDEPGPPDGETVVVSMYVYDALTDAPLGEAEWCEWPASEALCGLTDPDGRIEIEVPAGVALSATLEADGYYGRFFRIISPTEDQFLGNNAMIAEAGVELIAGMTGLEIVPGTGVIGFSTLADDPELGVAGVTVRADASLEGPYFTSEGVGFDLDATETNSVGAGSFLNVPPGDYTLTFEGRPCTLTFGLPADEPNQARLTVIADHWTQVDMRCEPES